MSGNDKLDAKQTTRKGLEIPIPTRKDFLANLKKVVKKPKDSTTDRPAD